MTPDRTQGGQRERAMQLVFVCLVFGAGILYWLYHAVDNVNRAFGFG